MEGHHQGYVYDNYYGYYYPEEAYGGQGQQGAPTPYLRGYVVPEWQEHNARLLESGHHLG